MIKSILTASTVVLTSIPAFSQQVPATMNKDVPPTIALSSVDVSSAIYCRNRARSKFFEFGAKNMSEEDLNYQWGLVGGSQVIVWCRGVQAIIGVAGYNRNSVSELREEFKKAF